MVICTVEVNEKSPQTIVIGRRGTYNTQEIVFDIGYLIDAYGAGTAVLAIKRSQDSSAYPTVITQEDTTLTWTVSETDTYYKGAGECELMWYVDGGLAKTIIYPLVVMRDILSTSEEAPDAYQEWVDDLTALGAETLQNAQDAAQSASDAESAKDAAEDAADSAEEAVEAFTHPTASAETLAPDAPATAAYNDGHFTFGIPKGDKGDKLTYSDLTEADKLDLIQGPIADAQTAAEQAVEDKGEEVLESIPQDYTNLADNVAEIDKVVDDLAALTGPNVLLSFGDFTDVEYDKGGNYVSCTWDESHTTCTYVLNITQPPFTWVAGIYNNNTELPDEIIPGNKYYVKFDRSIEPASYLSDFYLHINCYGANQSLIWAKRIRSNTEITIPEDCEGLWIRVHVATIAAPINLTGSMTLAMIDLNVPSNAELADEIDGLDDDLTDLSADVSDVKNAISDNDLEIADLVKRNSANVLLSFGNFKDNSSGNLGWTWDESHTTCTYSHTGQSPYVVPRIYNGSTSLPDVLTPGETYQLKFSATRGDLYLKVMYYANGTLIGNQAVYGDRAITIPDTCDGLVIEVSTPTWAFQGSITVALVNAPSNAELAESVETLTEDVETLESDVSSLSDNKAPVIISTASGDVATFVDGANNMPIKHLIAHIVHVQQEGIPSPTNPLPISGHTGLNMYHESECDAEANPIFTINWEDTAGTVYGGTLNIINGKLIVNKGRMIVDGNRQVFNIAARTNTVRFSISTNPAIATTSGTATTVISDMLPSDPFLFYNQDKLGVCGWNNALWLSIPIEAGSTDESIKAWLNANPITCVYPIASPIEYQLTPQEVTTLLGNNAIWTDVGPVTVEYPADTGLVVSQQKNAISANGEAVADTQSMIATVEATATASKNYSVGDLLVYDGKLYKVTSAIATGATITVGTNVTQTTVETQIASSGGGGGGGGETWYTAELSAANYDSTLKMIVFDAGSGKKIKDVIAIGQIVNDGTQTANEEIAFGVGITNGRRSYSCPCVTQGITSSTRRVGFLAQFSVREFTSVSSNYRTIFPQSFYYGPGATDATVINVDVPMTSTGATRATNLYYNFNDPRYFKVELPTWVPQWAYIKLYYTLQ